MAENLILFHGSPVKIDAGDYLNPAYCGMWENSQIYNHQTGQYDINALYFIKRFDIALLYARREIYAPEDAQTNTKYFIFDRPDYSTYVYEVNIPTNKLLTAMGRPATNFNGEVCCTEPVKIMQRHTYDISWILQYYGEKDKINTDARIINPKSENFIDDEFFAPRSFGLRGGMGYININNSELLHDLERHTLAIPGIAPYFYKQR